MSLEQAIFWVGVGQLSVLVASALVPMHLDWKKTLSDPAQNWSGNFFGFMADTL